ATSIGSDVSTPCPISALSTTMITLPSVATRTHAFGLNGIDALGALAGSPARGLPPAAPDATGAAAGCTRQPMTSPAPDATPIIKKRRRPTLTLAPPT